MSAIHKASEQIIQECNKDEISLSISRAYKKNHKTKIRYFGMHINKQC